MSALPYAPDPAVISTPTADSVEVILLHTETLRSRVLNETATLIWEGVREGATRDRIVAALVHTFEVDAAEADRCTAAFLTELHEEGFVCRVP